MQIVAVIHYLCLNSRTRSDKFGETQPGPDKMRFVRQHTPFIQRGRSELEFLADDHPHGRVFQMAPYRCSHARRVSDKETTFQCARSFMAPSHSMRTLF